MAHREQLAFVSLISRFFYSTAPIESILEIGSYDVNGSIRTCFANCKEYIGVDFIEGPGVDRVASGHEVDFPDASFDLAISCECFEHNPYWLATFNNMIRMTKNGGLVVFTCASKGRLEHGTLRTDSTQSAGTSAVGIDYYRNLQQKDFERSVDLKAHFQKYRFFYIPSSHDLYFAGIKNGYSQHVSKFDAFATEAAKIKKDLCSQSSFLKCIYIYLTYETPLTLLSLILNDRIFQAIALPYLRVRSAIENHIKNVCKNKHHPS